MAENRSRPRLRKRRGRVHHAHPWHRPRRTIDQARPTGPAQRRGGHMENVATMRRIYELLNDGDIDGFGGLVAGGFVEHEEVPGLEPTKEGVMQMFRMYRAAFPDLHMEVE